MPRPREDHPGKYVEAQRFFRLHHPDVPLDALGQVERCTEVIRRAIEAELEGFRVEEAGVVGVAAAAEGLDTSRTTVTQALEALAAQGYLEERRNAPYRIVSRRAVLPAAEFLAPDDMSLTRQLAADGGESLYERALFRVRPDRAGDPFRRLLDEALESTWDGGVVGALQDPAVRADWMDRDLFGLFRLRHIRPERQRRPRAWLVEVTWLRLSDEAAARIDAELGRAAQGSRYLAVENYLLEVGDVRGMVAGRNRLRVGAVPEELAARAQGLPGIERLDTTRLLGTRDEGSAGARPTVLRWDYPYFSRTPAGMCTYSVCYLDPECVQFFVRQRGAAARPPDRG